MSPMGKHQITATIEDKAGHVLSSAKNNYNKTHPLQAHFASNVGEPSRIFLHAEIAALIRLPKNSKPYKIVVSRFLKNGQPANASPCRVCQAALKHWNIFKIEHTL